MVFHVLEVGTSLFECFLAYIFFHNWFGSKDVCRSNFWLVFSTYLAINVICTLSPILPIFRSLINLVCLIFVAKILFDSTRILSVCGSILYMGVAVLSEYVTMVTMNALAYDTIQLMELGPERASYIAFAKLINLLIVSVASTVLGRNRGPLKIYQVLPLIPCQLISIYICHVFYLVSWKTIGLSENFVVVLLGLLYLNAITIVFISSIAAHAKLQHEKELEAQTFALQKEYYALVQKDQHETHALWHDISKYILAMKAIIESEGSDTALREFSVVQQEFERIGNIVDVDNVELNAILNYSVQKAQDAAIKVKLDVSVPTQISISAVDMSVIIGNTVDNAIEACRWLDDEQRYIDVVLRQKNDMLFYTIENPFLKSAPPKEGRTHGYGLKNVKRCVEKYKGIMIIEQENDNFIVSIRLNTKPA